MPRETREQRHARRMALADVRQREVQAVQAEELARALHLQVAGVRRGQDQDQDEEMCDAEQDQDPDEDAASTRALRSSDTSNDTSPTETPHGGSTPTRAAPVPAAIHARDRSGTVGGGRAGEVDCPATDASKVQAHRASLDEIRRLIGKSDAKGASQQTRTRSYRKQVTTTSHATGARQQKARSNSRVADLKSECKGKGLPVGG
ncbi:hypothetical protein JB92DRAFT_1111303 [Gautieria morchelliformis]|nr:hypothetical protein JB92DRAFT_1111303 [Gautieria morchelliformis]